MSISIKARISETMAAVDTEDLEVVAMTLPFTYGVALMSTIKGDYKKALLAIRKGFNMATDTYCHHYDQDKVYRLIYKFFEKDELKCSACSAIIEAGCGVYQKRNIAYAYSDLCRLRNKYALLETKQGK